MSTDTHIRPLFDPAVMPARDEMGYAYHPDLDRFTAAAEEGEDVWLDTHALKAAGFKVSYTNLGMELDEGDPAFDEYFVDDGCATKWQPEQPAGGGWQLVAVYDTEDGPYAMWLGRVTA